MAKRPHPRRTTTDPHAGPWTTCDRCSFVVSMNRMQFQYDYMGGSSPQNLGLLVCEKCLDDLSFQQKLLILPPDPQPIFNTRPENYVVDETNWLTTVEDEIYDTTSGDDYITTTPNPSQNPDATVLTLAGPLSTGQSTISVAYLDLFDGNPTSGGRSILQSITGSSARTNVYSSLSQNGQFQLVNPSVLTISSASASTANVAYVAIYDSATAGALIASGKTGASFPTITKGAAVQFDQLGLIIALDG